MDENQRIYLKDWWVKAHQLLSHKDMDVRDIALVCISLTEECMPKELVDKLRGNNVFT